MKNFFSSKKFVSTAALLAIVVSSQASAATITFNDGTAAGDGSGLTSKRLADASHATNNGANGFFVETFDAATPVTLPGTVAGTTDFNAPGAEGSGCAINSTGSGIMVVGTTDDIQVRNNSVNNGAAAPANDSTCYAHTPAVDPNRDPNTVDSSVSIDYSAFLAAQSEPVGITYLGFYWGSIDEYNTFSFFSGDDPEAVVVIDGETLTNAANAGNQTDPDTNQYVSIDFTLAEAFDRVVISTTGIAGEFDNIVIGLASRPVPAPAGLAFLGLGLLGLSFSRKFKK
ncbi:PEP-CTERM sorting domain-containing protein [Paraglaciecola chathamensis]|uniref:Npun_F0296 family exosortase-dependent surface protein n=1 Tax=Paraglaciecola chathamensis TaxID=368405 RepID=UPI002708447A|nr:PEP-CTERM sorting domain-containing protein [Paraglaciecola chathamensis]MDO6837999.1 PEP-CTERM sorting domain-containing protein [Paraglaciecola chathamensis]